MLRHGLCRAAAGVPARRPPASATPSLRRAVSTSIPPGPGMKPPPMTSAPTSWRQWANDPIRVWNGKVFRKGIRVVRVGALAGGIAVSGYAYGMLEVAADPEGFDRRMIADVLQQTGARHVIIQPEGADQTTPVRAVADLTASAGKPPPWGMGGGTATPPPPPPGSLPGGGGAREVPEAKMRAVAGRAGEVFARIKASAIAHAERQIKMLEDRMASGDGQGRDEETLQHWAYMERMLRGEWTLVVTDQQDPNAYVHGMLPKRMFVHSGIDLIAANDHELAMVIGHELSHALLSHAQEQLIVSGATQAAFLLAIVLLDPTGLLTFVAEMVVWGLQRLDLVSLGYSRDFEAEADDLGMRLAAGACYEPRHFHRSFERLAALEGLSRGLVWGSGMRSHQMEMFQSHPNPADRAKVILAASPELEEVYRRSSCGGIMRALWASLAGASAEREVTYSRSEGGGGRLAGLGSKASGL